MFSGVAANGFLSSFPPMVMVFFMFFMMLVSTVPGLPTLHAVSDSAAATPSANKNLFM